MRHHPVGVGELPRREGVRREPLVDQGHRRGEARIVQVGVVGAELVGEEHALVDEGPARHRDDVEAVVDPLRLPVDDAGDGLAQDEQPALEMVAGLRRAAAADERLAVHRLAGADGLLLRKAGIVDRDAAPAEQHLALFRDHPFDDGFVVRAQVLVARHEDVGDAVLAGLGQREAEPPGLRLEEVVRNLHQHAGAVAHQRVGPHGAAMREVLEDPEAVFDDLVRLAPLQIGDEADAAGIAVPRPVVEAGMRGRGKGGFTPVRTRRGVARRAHATLPGCDVLDHRFPRRCRGVPLPRSSPQQPVPCRTGGRAAGPPITAASRRRRQTAGAARLRA